MPKRKNILQKLSDFENEFKDTFKLTEESEMNETLFCSICKVNIFCSKKRYLEQHMKYSIHLKNIERTVNERPVVSQQEFNEDLCRLFVSTNTPLKRLASCEWKRFVSKYTEFQIPNESNLRQHYMPLIYESTLERVLEEIGDSDIWLSTDETKDRNGRHVVNVMVGPLDANKQNKGWIINTEFPKNVNNITINQIVMNSLLILWPNGIQYEKFLVLITDGASYMKTCGENLKMFFPKLTHLICLCHNLHNLSEFIAHNYPKTERLMKATNMVFSKSDKRKEIFNDKGLSLPPKLITTRWGSYFNCAEYYNKHFDTFNTIVQSFESKETLYFNELKTLLKDKDNIKDQLKVVLDNFSDIPIVIKSLESEKTTLTEKINLFENLRKKLKENITEIGIQASNRLEEIIWLNPGYEDLRMISDMIDNNSVNPTYKYSKDQILNFKNCFLSNASIERSFSKYRFILSDRRTNFSNDNLKSYLISNININCMNEM